MSERKTISAGEGRDVASSHGTDNHSVDAFVADARRLGEAVRQGNSARLVFALDATMSRQPTWDLACALQSEMFAAAAEIGGLAVQLVYFRGFSECKASRWVVDPAALTALMTRISCRSGHTQIGRMLRHVRKEAAVSAVRALVFVGDAAEESLDDLGAAAGELRLLGVKAFMFQEDDNPAAKRAFEEIARLTGGAYARFDSSAPQSLSTLLRAAAVYASGGANALTQLAVKDGNARLLLTAMERNR